MISDLAVLLQTEARGLEKDVVEMRGKVVKAKKRLADKRHTVALLEAKWQQVPIFLL